jgi:hypothetical protein
MISVGEEGVTENLGKMVTFCGGLSLTVKLKVILVYCIN